MIATFLLPQELGPCSTQATFGRSLLKTTNDPTLFPCEKGSNGIGRDQKPVLLVLLGRHEPPFVSRKMVLYPIFVAPSVSFCTTYCIWVIYIYIYYINSTMEMSLVDGSAMYIYILIVSYSSTEHRQERSMLEGTKCWTLISSGENNASFTTQGMVCLYHLKK